MRLEPITIVNPTSHGVAQYTPTIVLKRDKNVVFSYKHAGTVTATIFLQVGVMLAKLPDGTPASIQWKTTIYTFDTLPAGSNSSDSETWWCGAYDCVRLVVTAASGAGTISPSVNIKD